MAADSGGLTEPLHLEPFIHQVGGHSSMLQLDDDTICKPLITQELNFYNSAPECLKEFIAEYKGVIEVSFSEDNDGYLDLKTYLPSTYKNSTSRPNSRQNSLTENNERKTKHRIRLCQSGSIQIESTANDEIKTTFEECNHKKPQNGSPLNPWVLHCHQEQMKKLRKSSSTNIQKYILLENRVSKYEFPCILDIKMGTRQYGDDAPLAKRQSHTAKAASSTSAILGVRISGMQVYQQDSGRYICHNKYYGRSLTVEGFHQALHHFLHDGKELRQNIIIALIEKLHKLYTVVQSLNTFRFFTSSLLIIYNGKKSYHSLTQNKNEICEKAKVCLQLNDNGNIEKEKMTETSRAQQNFCTTYSKACDMSILKNSLIDIQIESKNPDFLLPLIDLCMIDFAHSTHSQMSGSPVAHVGPDEGYLFGLQNLIAHLEMLLKESKKM